MAFTRHCFCVHSVSGTDAETEFNFTWMKVKDQEKKKKINWSTVTYPNTLTYNWMPFTVWGVFISRLNECSDREVRGLKVSEATRLHRCGRQVIFIWTLMVFISVLYEEAGNSPFFGTGTICNSVGAWELPALSLVGWNWAQNQEELWAHGIQNASPYGKSGIMNLSGVLELGRMKNIPYRWLFMY